MAEDDDADHQDHHAVQPAKDFPSCQFYHVYGRGRFRVLMVIIVTERFSNSAIVMTILGMLLFFIGLIADQISILNRKY